MALIRRGLVKIDYLARLGAKNTYKAKFEALCAAIDNAPAVDAEPVKHGQWEHLGGDEWRCTNCGEIIHTEGSWEKPTSKYCRECGTKMEGSAE